MDSNREESLIASIGDADHALSQKFHHKQWKQQRIEENNCKQVNNNQKQKQLLQHYFEGLYHENKGQQSSRKIATKFIQIVEETVLQNMETGQIWIGLQKVDLSKVIRQQNEETKKNRNLQLEYLNRQIVRENLNTNQSRQQIQVSPEQKISMRVFSKTQHRQFMRKLEKSRKKQQMKKKNAQEQRLKRLQHESKLKKLAQQQQRLHQKEEKHVKILESLQKNRDRHETYLKLQQQSDKKIDEIKHHKPLYQLKQEKYEAQVLLPILQQKKKKLKQIRENIKSFNVSDLDVHQQNYLKIRQESLKKSQSKQKQKKSDWHYDKPQKSEKLIKLLEEEKMQAKIKFQEKKRKIQEKKYRQEQYIATLRERFSPKPDPKLQEEIRKRIASEQRQTTSPKRDRKLIGQNYLQEMKKKAKKHSVSYTQNNKVQINDRSTNQSTNYLQKKHKSKKQYEQLRLRRIQKLIRTHTSQRSEQTHNIKQLQYETEKLLEGQRWRQKIIKAGDISQEQALQVDGDTINLLLTSIKAKMEIMNLYSVE